MHRDVDRADDLRHAIQSYERAVHKRRALMARTAVSSTEPPPSRDARRLKLGRPALVAGLVLVVSVAVVTLRDRGEPVVGPNETRTPAAPQLPLPSSVARVVLDPGHGGQDPGAEVDELREAALVLDVAERLETRLKENTRIEVVLTRRDDVFVPLRARIELANRVDADLFLSIHANASRNPLMGGIATFHLKGPANRAARAAAAENPAVRSETDRVPYPVRSIARNDTRGGVPCPGGAGTTEPAPWHTRAASGGARSGSEAGAVRGPDRREHA